MGPVGAPEHMKPGVAAEMPFEPDVAGLLTQAERPMDQGSRADLRTMFEENYAFIWRILRRFGVAPQNVDDAAQQVFLVAARKIDVVDRAKARSFLLGTALRVAAEARRAGARAREEVREDLDLVASAAPNPEQLTEKKRALERFDALLDEMPFELRAVFVLYEVEGMSTHDIAPALGLPRGTVASRLRRAREEFDGLAKRAKARAASGLHREGRAS